MNDNDFRNFIEEVRARTDIVEVIGQHVNLNHTNMGKCPFHEDNNPSFSVNPEGQYYNCFGCDAGGDVFDFLIRITNKSLWEVLKELANTAGFSPPNLTDKQENQIKQQRLNEDILTTLADYYSTQLPKQVREYLINDRGLTEGTIAKYKIGYAPHEAYSSVSGLLQFLAAKGYTKEQAIEAGVLYDNGKEYFAGHIIFPNLHHGRVVYLTGRGYPEKSHKKPLKEKLPLNHMFLEQVANDRKPIITEGEIDTYTLCQAGFNACGVLGTGGFKKGWEKKFRNAETVYISLDGDEEGKKATLKLAETFGNKARLVSFPDFIKPDGNLVKDWNELLVTKHSSDIESFQQEYQHLLDNAQTLLESKITHIPQDTNKRDIPRILEPIITEIALLPETEQTFYIDVIINHFKPIMNFKRQELKRDIKQSQKQITKTKEETVEILDDGVARISPALDFVDGIAYMTIPLDVNVNGKLSKQYYIITSSREFIGLDADKLFRERNILLKSQPNIMGDNRWAHKDIKKFINRKPQTDPVVTFIDIRETYKEYLDFKEPYTAEIIALWTMGTYIFPVFESYPYLFLCGEKESGKTKTLNVANKLCFNAVHSSDISTAMLFRIIEGSSSTMLIDEAEALKSKKQSEDIRLLLNSGYKRGGCAYRVDLNTFEPQRFEVYSPKLIANIGGLEKVLESRCIKITMLRTRNKEKSDKVVIERGKDWEYLRNHLYSFGLHNFQEIQDIYLNEANTWNLKAVSGREAELWFPLLSIALCIDRKGYEGLFDRMKDVALKKSMEVRDTGLDDWSVALLLGLKDITISQEEKISNKDIREKMKEYLDDDSNLPTPHWTGKTLDRYGLVENSKHTNKGFQYTIRFKAVQDIIERYGV